MSEESLAPKRNPPRLAPAPPGSREPEVNTNPSTIRKYVTTACSECRVRKLKCSGESPCKSCVEHGRECVLDPEGDKRRRLQQRKRVSELEDAQELLMLLVQRLRESDRKDAVHLLNFIRKNASLEEIQQFLQQDSMRQISDIIPELIDVQQAISRLRSSHAHSGRGLDVGSLSEEPLHSVPAKPWTDVTDDARLVSHLVSIWFTWNSPVSSCIDVECFVEAMQSANEGSQYCSPFLVNSLLASAASFCEHQELFANSGEMTSRGAQFYIEATKMLNELLEEDDGLMNLSALQGLAILAICAITSGKDRQGLKNLSLLKYAVDEFIDSHASSSSVSGEESSKFERVQNRTFWGIFNIMTMVRMGMMAPLDFPPPNRPKLAKNDEGEEEWWFAYPLTTEKQIGSETEIFNALCSLSCIVSEIGAILFGFEEKPAGTELELAASQFLQRLEEWNSGLPVGLRIETTPSPVRPDILHLHMYYDACIIELLAFVRRPDGSLPASASQTGEQRLVSSAKRLASSARLFQSTWSAEWMSEMTLPWMAFGMAALVINLDDALGWEDLIDLCRVVERSFCERWTISRGIFRMFQLSVGHIGIKMPHEVRVLFDDFEKRHWEKTDPSVFRSCFPNYMILLAEGEMTVEGEMDNFLSKWDKFTISRSPDPVLGGREDQP